nr:fimbrillin family protein [uncultured Bacteroides sp.]
MNYKSFIFAAAVLTLGLTACSKDEVLQTENLSADAVRINATVGNLFAETRSNPVGNIDEQAKFNVGDEITVAAETSENDPNPVSVIYKYDGEKWTPKDGKFLTWKIDNMFFEAVYPAVESGATIGSVEIDQSTLEKIAKCDWMTAAISGATKGQVLNFAMQRLTSRLVVKIAGFNPEFAADAKVTDVKIVDQSDAVPQTTPATTYTDYIPYPQGDGSVGSTYTLLRGKNMRYQYISLKVGNKEMRTAILNDGENGKSYTYNLRVGKEKIEIESVTVSDWTNSETIPGGSAGEIS